jgi:hypothetical protein
VKPSLIACAAGGAILSAALAFQAGAAERHVIALSQIAEPGAYRIVSSAALDQYDSRSFVSGAGEGKSFAEAMAAQNLHLGAELFAALRSALMRGGFSVGSNADAILTAGIEPGSVQYTDQPLGDDLMPSYAVTLTLKDAKTGMVLLDTRILYGETSGDGVRAIYPDARYRFTSPGAVMADPVSAAEGLRAGLPLIAAEIAKLAAR